MILRLIEARCNKIRPPLQALGIPVIGFPSVSSTDTYQIYFKAFREGLKEVGYIDGQNVAIKFRWTEGHYDRLLALADRPGPTENGRSSTVACGESSAELTLLALALGGAGVLLLAILNLTGVKRFKE